MSNLNPLDIVSALKILGNEKLHIKGEKSALGKEAKSASASIARLGFTARNAGVVEETKEAFKEIDGEGKTRFSPVWSALSSDFSHGAAVCEFLLQGGKIAIKGTVSGQPVTEVTKACIPAMLDGMQTEGDLEVSSLWKHVLKLKKARAEDTATKTAQVSDVFSAYLTSAQCDAAHEGMTVEQLMLACAVDPEVGANVNAIGRQIVDAQATVAALTAGRNAVAARVTEIVEAITEYPELFAGVAELIVEALYPTPAQKTGTSNA